MKHPDFRIVQFTKSPDSRRVKTRMSSVLNQQARSRLHWLMTCHVCETAAQAGLCPVQLWVDGDLLQPVVGGLAEQFSVECHPQEGPDLGARMYNAARKILADCSGVIFVGSDCPFIDADYLARAATNLDGHDAVLGPAHDGGYVLLGLRRLSPALFSNIPWGTGGVLAATQARLQMLGWRYAMLPTLADIDRPDDLALLAASNLPEPLQQFAG